MDAVNNELGTAGWYHSAVHHVAVALTDSVQRKALHGNHLGSDVRRLQKGKERTQTKEARTNMKIFGAKTTGTMKIQAIFYFFPKKEGGYIT